jgi:transposase
VNKLNQKNKRMQTQNKFAATIGLDWADIHHDLWLQAADGGQPEHLILDQRPEVLHSWIAQIRARFKNQPVAFAIETSRGPVLSALLAYDFITVFPINPKALSSYRDAFRVSGAKDDRSDALLLEQYLRHYIDQLRPLCPDTVLTRQLAGLVEKRRALVDLRTQLVNQLHAELKMFYPLAQTLLDKLTTPLAAAFLKKWPTLEALQKAGAHKVRAFFYGHNCRSAKKLQARLDALASAVALTTDPALIVPASLTVQTLASLLEVLHDSIATLDQEINTAMDAHPDAPIFRSFPGAGPALAPRLLVAFGTQRDRFQSAQEVQQLYGIAPVTQASGQSHVVHMRYRCPKFGRQSFHENAHQACKKEPWARAYYDHQRKSKKHQAAVRAVAFKLMRIYFVCWRDRKTYDGNTYASSLEKRGSAWVKPQPKPGAKSAPLTLPPMNNFGRPDGE